MVDKAESTQERELVLRKVYIKDLSFESPRPTESLIITDLNPYIDFNVSTQVRSVSENFYEVTLRITITAIQKDTDKALYLIEVSQAGLFEILGHADKAELTEVLNSRCADILLPFVRESISTVIMQGGFPPLLLQPIQFDRLYRQYLEQAVAESVNRTDEMESTPEQLKSESK